MSDRLFQSTPHFNVSGCELGVKSLQDALLDVFGFRQFRNALIDLGSVRFNGDAAIYPCCCGGAAHSPKEERNAQDQCRNLQCLRSLRRKAGKAKCDCKTHPRRHQRRDCAEKQNVGGNALRRQKRGPDNNQYRCINRNRGQQENAAHVSDAGNVRDHLWSLSLAFRALWVRTWAMSIGVV